MNAIIAGFTAPFTLIPGTIIAFSIYDGILLPVGYYAIFSLALFGLLWSLRGLGVSDLDRAISIVDFVQGNPNVIIRVKSGTYADEILAMNQSSKKVRRKRNPSS